MLQTMQWKFTLFFVSTRMSFQATHTIRVHVAQLQWTSLYAAASAYVLALSRTVYGTLFYDACMCGCTGCAYYLCRPLHSSCCFKHSQEYDWSSNYFYIE